MYIELYIGPTTRVGGRQCNTNNNNVIMLSETYRYMRESSPIMIYNNIILYIYSKSLRGGAARRLASVYNTT